jgi:hypothetical protein
MGAWRLVGYGLVLGACGAPAGSPDAALVRDTAAIDTASFPATLDGDRDRLLATYVAYLALDPSATQSNGLSGANVHDRCMLWSALAPSAQDVFLTITHRLDHAILADGSPALDPVTRLYRVVGGQDATSTAAGTCGGGEYNRMIMQMDPALHDAQVAANTNQGAMPYDLADAAIGGGFWRDSHDLGGSHAPFDRSDETNDGAPRGQTQYFADPTSAVATAPLGRLDLTTLVDPYALEMDQDYDCVHNSNPGCDYTFYGPLCATAPTEPGTQIYTEHYGDFEPAWQPSGC